MDLSTDDITTIKNALRLCIELLTDQLCRAQIAPAPIRVARFMAEIGKVLAKLEPDDEKLEPDQE